MGKCVGEWIDWGTAVTLGGEMSVSNSVVRRAGQRVVRSVVAMAAVAMLSTAASASLIDVDAITTGTGMGVASTTTAPGGVGSQFGPNKTYTINFEGGSAPVTSITAGGNTYSIVKPADTITVRANQNNNKSPDRGVLFYQGSVTGNTVNLKGTRQNSLSDALKQNDVYVGVDNLFTNKGGFYGDNVRSERLDVVFSSGVTASANKVFGVFDRGFQNGFNSHDPFKIAAITSVDANGNPTGYGEVISVAKGWGQTSLIGSAITTVNLRNDPHNSSLTSPAALLVQPVGGVLIPTDDLVGAGVTIYGYSLFAYDVTGTGNQLLDWTNKNYFPPNTNHVTNGLDLLSITGLIQLNAVPEPASLSLLAFGGGAMLMRRRRKA
ncbi:hypothetical protein BH10PLA1_BH10PLA1_22080 [soil metagenome]